ncbi:hypothetical protein TNCV_4990901 [Trichonephila clavipes]|nr:hypothetical protein TNCV_4990901 [Trichonephila clavipes]
MTSEEAIFYLVVVVVAHATCLTKSDRGLRNSLWQWARYSTESLKLRNKSNSRDSLVVKVTDSWLACHEFEPSTAEGACSVMQRERCTLNMWKLKCPSIGVVRKLGGKRCLCLGVTSSSLGHGSKLRGPSPKPPE